MKIIFFGSPDFALPSLEALVDAGHEIPLVVSQPAKPVGRKALLTDPPVVQRARELNLVRYQPVSLRDEETVSFITRTPADLFVVVAYGKILPQSLLDAPRLGALNVHGSLLPRWRGASPVQAALLAGDPETGVSLMKMEAGMDTGPVYAEAKTAIGAEETALDLGARLAKMGAALLAGSLPAIGRGELAPAPQDPVLATSCPKIRREDGRVDWRLPAEVLMRKSRAFTPWPGLFALREGRRVKLENVTTSSSDFVAVAPGTVVGTEAGIEWACGAGVLRVATLQVEGRTRQPADEFIRRERVVVGELWT